MRITLDIPEDIYKRYTQYYEPYQMKQPEPQPDDCPNCKGCGNVEVSHVNQCYMCGGKGKIR